MPPKPLALRETPIPGLLVLDLPVPGDNRGWFKENWQREKMLALGLPDFGPVQNNVSFNDEVGVTRGIHAEPWDKFVSVVLGKVFGAWVDLREGPSFGTVFTVEIDPTVAVFVPRGVANSYQTLEPQTVYSYLVNDHWSPDAGAKYTFLNLADETVAVPWPIPLEDAILSDKDKLHPRLANVVPMPPRKTLVLGANGQLGRALRGAFPDAEFAERGELDITAPEFATARAWRDYAVIINAAAYTKVDEAETDAGRKAAWSANVVGVTALARVATANGITLVHISSDYVFDGTAESHPEDEPFSPLGVYGQTKAAGDAIVAAVPRHYLVRTSWVVGDGNNFVRTMKSLAERGIDPRVVDDQFGRLSFASELAAGIRHLIDCRAPYGTYNLTGSGAPVSWAEIARRVFAAVGSDPQRVAGVTTDEYFAGKTGAPRPRNSALTLDKIESVGFAPRDHFVALDDYLSQH